jgi:hypothetical protein
MVSTTHLTHPCKTLCVRHQRECEEGAHIETSVQSQRARIVWLSVVSVWHVLVCFFFLSLGLEPRAVHVRGCLQAHIARSSTHLCARAIPLLPCLTCPQHSPHCTLPARPIAADLSHVRA